MEAGELDLYILFVCLFATLFQHPASSVRHLISGSLARRALYGLAVGCTVVGIVMTPWGKQSGVHFNPAITFTFYRLGKVELWDALFYAVAQFFGATCGVAIAAYFCEERSRIAQYGTRLQCPGSMATQVRSVAK
jgi:aquaporin Z